MANSGEINKLYFDLLVSKNKLPLLQTYYTNIKNEILTDLTELYNYIYSAQTWVDSQIAYLNTSKTIKSTEVNDFVASSTDNLIVQHPKYIEMLEKYQSYVNVFYNRMHSLEASDIANSYTVSNFIKNEIGQISSYWKFHYSTLYEDASNVEHKFCALNMTSESDLLELSNNRYIYITNENIVYDVDYNTKDVYLLYLDNKTDTNLQGIDYKFNTIFTLPDTGKFYAIIRNGELSKEEVNVLNANNVVGGNITSKIYRFVIYEYDSDNHEFIKTNTNTSEIYSNDPDSKFKILDNVAINGFYYAYIGKYVIRIKVNSTTNDNVLPYVHTFDNIISEIVYFDNYFVFPKATETGNNTRLVACKQTDTGLISTDISASIILNSFATSDTRHNTDNQIVTIFKSTNVGGKGTSALYVVTNTNIWYIKSIGSSSTIQVIQDNRKTDIGLSDYSFLTNKGLYLIDDLGYFFVLKNPYIYGAKTDSTGTELYGNIVQAPTRYADRLLNLKSADSDDTSGYAYAVGTDITSPQNGTPGLQDIIYQFIKNGVLYCITRTGRIAYCELSTGKWNYNNTSKYCLSSFTGDKEITTICDGEEEGDLFIALSNYTIYKITQAELIANDGANITTSNKYLIYNTNTGTKITAMLYIAKYKTLYIGDKSGFVSVYDFNSGDYHTCDTSHKNYNEADKAKYAITKGDNCIGNVSITGITTEGNNLIVLGDYGRVSSCSFSTFKWTPYNTSADSISQYDSNIYFNGQYTDVNNDTHTCGNIVSFINYNNARLVVFTYNGEVFSCNLATGVWTDPVGKIVLHNGSGFGPGIYNTGTILEEGHVPFAVTRVGTTLFVTGSSGRIASVNITTGGITTNKGINAAVETGPGYSYTGEDIAETNEIHSIISDGNGKLYLAGTNNTVLTFSIEGNEALIPTNNKLYYVSRRQTKYDYLSALLVRLTKTALTEKAPLYPPSEDSDIFQIGYRSDAYVFKCGKYVRRLSATLDLAYYSDDEGVNYTTVTHLNNSDLLPLSGTSSSSYDYVTSMTRGVVTPEGEAFIILNIGQEPYTYLLYMDIDHNYTWFKLTKLFDQVGLNSIKYIGNHSIFIGDRVYSILDSILTEINTDTRFVSYNNIENVLFTLKNNQIFYYYDKENSKETSLGLTVSDIEDYVTKTIGPYSTLTINGMFAGKNNSFNLIIVKDEDYYVLTIHFDELGLGKNADNWYINFISLDSEVLSMFTNLDGSKTFLIGNKVIQIFNQDSYGRYVTSESRILSSFDSKIEEFAYDPENAKIYIAVYDTAENNGLITHTNSIHSFKDYSGLIHTPIRAISDAWRSCQIELGNGSDTSIPNAVSIKLKFRNNPNDNEADIVSANYSLRYRVLISNITNGKFILYETEKTIGMSKTDDETGTVEPFIRVLAIDGFEDEIFELFTSKIDSQHNVYSNSEDLSDKNYSYDFMTFIQRFTGSSKAVYQIKINCLSTLPNSVDAKFFVEPYYQDTTAKKSATYVNNIDLSEYKTTENNTENNVIFGKILDGIISRSKINNETANKPIISNIKYIPQQEPSFNISEYNVSADTYMSIIRGNGLGLYDKINCVLMYNDSKYSLVPLSKNKKDLRFIFDFDGSKAILDDTKFEENNVMNGRTVHKMHNHSIFSKNVINNPNYYIDYNGKSRIVNVEGKMINRYGLFEGISSIDGSQKRVKQISEIRDGTIWRNSNSAYDLIKNREYGYGFDIVDRYAKYEEPYDMIRAWWIPAKGNITKGNERLLNFTYSDSINNNTIGKKYNTNDLIPSVTIAEKVYSGGSNPTDVGVSTTMNGTVSSDSIEAYTELIDEKFPLENWTGFEWAKMCFIRKWRIVYTDKHIKYYYDVEAPSAVTVDTNKKVTLEGSVIIRLDSIPYTAAEFATSDMTKILAAIKPSINQQLYYYTDIASVSNSRNEYEGISTEKWRRCTAWYYTSHSWKVYLDENIILDHPNFFTNNTEADIYLENQNKGRTTASAFEAFMKNATVNKTWYVTDSTDTVNTDNTYMLHHDANYELDNGQTVPLFLASINTPDSNILTSNFPIPNSRDGNIVGERIVSINIPTPISVTKVDAYNSNLSWDDISQTNEATSLFTQFNVGAVKSALSLGGKKSSSTFDYYYNIEKNPSFLDNNKNLVDNSSIYSYSSRNNTNKYYIHPEFADASNEYSAIKLSSSQDGKTIIGQTGIRRSGTTDNTFAFKYGVGGIYPLYTNSGFGTTRVSHTITVVIRSYSSINKSETNASKGWFVNYTDTTYTIVIDQSKNALNIVSNNSNNKVTLALTSGSNGVSLDGYAGRSTLKYLYKYPFTIKVNNLVKNEGYTSVFDNLYLWSINDANITNNTKTSISGFLETEDATFDLTKYRNALFADDFSFITLNKTQSIGNITDASIVDRVFVKQFFTNEKSTTGTITWANYKLLYNTSITNFIRSKANSSMTTYPQTYKYIEFKNNSITGELKTEDCTSDYLWLELKDGTAEKTNFLITTDSSSYMNYCVAGEFHFAWHDGTTKVITFTTDDGITLQNLVDNGFIVSVGTPTETVTRHTTDDYYDKTCSVSVTYPALTIGKLGIKWNYTNKTSMLYATAVVEYTETTNTLGNTTYSKAANWVADTESTSTTGLTNATTAANTVYKVTFDLTNMHPEGLNNTSSDTINRNDVYSIVLHANDGYNLPDSINVQVGSTGTVAEGTAYIYNRSYVESDNYIFNSAKTVLDIISSLSSPTKSGYTFVGYSLDGVNALTSAEKNTTISANTDVVIYRLYNNNNDARVTINGSYTIDNIKITGVAVAEN